MDTPQAFAMAAISSSRSRRVPRSALDRAVGSMPMRWASSRWETAAARIAVRTRSGRSVAVAAG
ncbi:hypothetical protein [Streptomyces sp. STR69]|uniref:hypothetical protein n=1 Tax=Streptomyces sp. STR69 TaxID=1796942 RepID=UPI0021C97B54|nr:hypothetical protein [Streptomyces sp. STR69]